MATYSSVLAWRMPGTQGLVGCRLWGCTESDTTNIEYQMFKQAVLANLLHVLRSITYFCYLEVTQIPMLLRLSHIRLQTFFRTWIILAYACYCILKVQHNARHINIK